MDTIRQVRLDLLRAGPTHNQLLSPLTPYIAMCGDAAAQVVHMPYEHQQLLMRLERLRYETEDGGIVPQSQREAELREIGIAMGSVLGQVAELDGALKPRDPAAPALTHLRLSLAALELGLMPFEAAISPEHFPGAGSPLLLHTRTIITREVRRRDEVPVQWDRTPRILFAYASPPRYLPVPAQAHLNALRIALGPYIAIRDEARDRADELRATVTVVPNATLRAIETACGNTEYTHVHILAHGAPFDDAGTRRYGIALCAECGGGEHVVSGELLGLALRGVDSSSSRRALPTLVSLATCDSGRVGNVLAPASSVAHELHQFGVPWVVASQFPFTMRASSVATRVLYAGLLRGEDPRHILYELRQRLRTAMPHTHDWATIIAYAAMPADFNHQIAAFWDKRIRARLDVRFDRIDALVRKGVFNDGATAEIGKLSDEIRLEHAQWTAHIGRGADPKVRAEVLGMLGASEKRIAAVLASSAGDTEKARRAYLEARNAYRSAAQADPTNHWVITQLVSIVTVPLLMADGEEESVRHEYIDGWNAARGIARWQLHDANDEDRAWALGTLAELALLGSVYQGPSFDRDNATREVVDCCRGIVEAVGAGGFAVRSTRRQFTRYLVPWRHERWIDLAQAAVAALSA